MADPGVDENGNPIEQPPADDTPPTDAPPPIDAPPPQLPPTTDNNAPPPDPGTLAPGVPVPPDDPNRPTPGAPPDQPPGTPPDPNAPPPGAPPPGGAPGAPPPAAPAPPNYPAPPAYPKPPPLAGGGWSEADFQQYMQYLQKQADIEAQRYTNEFGLKQKQFDWQKEFQQKDLDLRTAIATATQAYQTSLIQTRNVELAQTAARDAMTRDFQMQELSFRREQNAAQLSTEREKLDLQRRLLPASRTTRRAATVQTI